MKTFSKQIKRSIPFTGTLARVSVAVSMFASAAEPLGSVTGQGQSTEGALGCSFCK
jgi:hypothetical protein